MLTEKQLEAFLSKIQWRVDKVNTQYLEMVAEQIKKIGKLSPSSIRRLEQMRIYGANSAKIKKQLAEALKVSTKEVEEILKKAAEEEYTSHDFDGVYRDRGAIPLAYNPRLQKYIESLARQTAETMLNFSNTTNVDFEYKEVVSDAIDAVSRGVVDYNSAIRSSMRQLGGDGLRVTYESGYTRRMDSAIRMNILDSVRQVSQKANEMNGQSIGADGVELSAHPYSALDHEPAQGRQYTLAEFEKMQSGQDFQDVDGNQYKGFRRPIGQWNCHHLVSYIIIGISKRRYTDEQLKQWKEANHKGVEIDGKKYTVYQATQLMRKLETEVRKQKDIANMAKISGDDVLRREAQAKIRDLNKKYTEVAQAAGLKERREKMEVSSYTPLSNMNQSGYEVLKPPASIDGNFDDFEELKLTGVERDTLLKLRDLAKESGHEYGSIIHAGKAEEPFTSNLYDKVHFDRDNLKYGSNLIHSHTNGTPLSSGDLSLLTDKRVDSIANISYNGDIFRVSVGYGIRPDKYEYSSVAANIAQQVDNDIQDDPEFYSWTEPERNYMSIREKMYRIAREFEWKIEGGRLQ